jgi:AcrR family transcriptional regulator
MATRARQSSESRREALIDAAIAEFAHGGLQGTAVSAITDRVGITQPYAFSLFKRKKDLFLAAVERCFEFTEDAFRTAAESAAPDARLEAMGTAYAALLGDREKLLLQLHGYAACGDPEIRAVVRRGYARLYELVQELSGAGEEELTRFFAMGMLMNVAAAIDMPELVPEKDWLEEGC